MILSIWRQADDGKVPVSGAGYRGPFSGPGFDGMWTDMSEIVRPTRDGIHGREYINTSVDIGRKLDHLEFDREGRLVSTVPRNIEIPLPIVFDASVYGIGGHFASIAGAAARLGTLAVFRAADTENDLTGDLRDNVVPLLSEEDIEANPGMVERARVVEIECRDGLSGRFETARRRIERISDAIVFARVAVTADIGERALELAGGGAEVIHIAADHHGLGLGGAGSRFIKEAILGVHDALVGGSLRDRVTLVVSGGIAAAEHVPKAIICGADAVAIDIPLLVCLGYSVCGGRRSPLAPPDTRRVLAREVATQRIVNLAGSWHSQLLEVLGAMGIREVRRLRGERGRAMFYDELDQEAFGGIFAEGTR
jgi:hypothetical protein